MAFVWPSVARAIWPSFAGPFGLPFGLRVQPAFFAAFSEVFEPFDPTTGPAKANFPVNSLAQTGLNDRLGIANGGDFFLGECVLSLLGALSPQVRHASESVVFRRSEKAT